MRNTRGMATFVIPQSRDVYHEIKIVIIECASCSVDFGIGKQYQDNRRKDHGSFYCPNGHSNVYNQDNEEEKQRKRADAAEARARSWRDQAEAAERSRIAQKAATTRLQKRVANGICPCCHRSFQNLRRHMSGQHPDFTEDDQ